MERPSAGAIDIGRVFTPLRWAMWLVESAGAFRAWLDGAAVLDPTCGEGAFLEAFIVLACREGISVTGEALGRLHGVEMVAADKRRLLDRLHAQYRARLPEDNITTADFITAKIPGRYGVVVGNPPWINFSDLPRELRIRWAPAYFSHRLVKDKRDVLLGGSRADVAALVLKKALDESLADGGTAAFFIPLSVFFNSGANDLFRPFPASGHAYRVVRLWDFGRESVFDGIATRYGAVRFDRRGAQTWPVETSVFDGGAWTPSYSSASDGRCGPWRQHRTPESGVPAPPAIGISSFQKPRQGVNTCGANDILVFERTRTGLRNGLGEEFCEEREPEGELLFPLMNAGSFGRPFRTPQRWILLPHDRRTGRPLGWSDLAKYERAAAYLFRHRGALAARRGTLINALVGRGFWWSLLGVGSYSFTPWKVAWEALGQKTFMPAVIDGRWQGNQAMHAFCPCSSPEEAAALAAALRRPEVEAWLKSSAMAGTCNWAQPGRMAQLLTVDGATVGGHTRRQAGFG